MTKSNIPNDRVSLTPIILIGALVVTFWIATPFVVLMVATNLDLQQIQSGGPFGDMYGAVNALFSGLAFAGVIYAILLQRRELSLQRKELRLTRHELAGSREQQERQSDALTKQNFESTFFQMLSLHNEILDGIMYGGATTGGRPSISQLLVAYKGVWKNQQQQFPDPLARAHETYAIFFKSNENYVGHYFRNMYRIVRYVHESNVADKQFYVGILRAQLSSDEQILLFYNGLSDHGDEKFKPLIEEYALLENMPQDKLNDPKTDVGLYDAKAYGEAAK